MKLIRITDDRYIVEEKILEIKFVETGEMIIFIQDMDVGYTVTEPYISNICARYNIVRPEQTEEKACDHYIPVMLVGRQRVSPARGMCAKCGKDVILDRESNKYVENKS